MHGWHGHGFTGKRWRTERILFGGASLRGRTGCRFLPLSLRGPGCREIYQSIRIVILKPASCPLPRLDKEDHMNSHWLGALNTGSEQHLQEICPSTTVLAPTPNCPKVFIGNKKKITAEPGGVQPEKRPPQLLIPARRPAEKASREPVATDSLRPSRALLTSGRR